DPFAAAFSWTALVLLLSGSSIAAFFSGILMVAACTAKFYMAYAFLPAYATILISTNRVVSKPRQLVLFTTGAALAGLLWLFAIYLPNRPLLLSYNAFYASQQAQVWSPVAVIKNIVMQPFYLYAVKSPAILLLGNLMLWRFLARPKQAEPLERSLWI